MDWIGQRFGRWIVQETVRREGIAYWICRCDCGNQRTVNAYSITHGISQSCGCTRSERAIAAKTTHGMSGTQIYAVWCTMIARCHNPKNPSFTTYGLVGIKVCDEWRQSFARFFADMGPRPSPRHSLDRWPNPSGNYEPGNVRWATPQEQARNSRTVVMLTLNGTTQCLTDWATDYGMKEGTLRARLKYGWSLPDALQTPVSRWRSGWQRTWGT